MSTWVPDYTIHVNGTELSEIDHLNVERFMVDLRRQEPSSVEVQFNNKEKAYDDHDGLKPGSTLKIGVGYEQVQGSDKLFETVFEGEIIGTSARVLENGPRVFFVRAFDYMHRLTRGRKTRTFLEQKFSDIVSQVASDWGLSADAEDTEFVREYVIQHNQTDIDFARGIAGWLDFDIFIPQLEDPKKLRFKAPNVSADAALKLVYESPNLAADESYLRRFEGRQSLARVVSEVVVRGWDPKTKREIIGRAGGSMLYAAMGDDSGADEVIDKWGETDRQLVDYKVFSQEEADKIARTKLNEYARTFIRADLEMQGHPKAAPGQVVEVSKVADKFDGPYYVERVVHIFDSKVDPKHGYSTRLQAARCGW